MAVIKRLPLNIELMDINKMIKERGILEVTSTLIHTSSSTEFHPDGLFSERIFGEIASPERHLRHGYINLRCRVFHPIVFQNLQSIKRFYVEIISGKSYAIWNKQEKDFERADEFDEGADTGFVFFLTHFPEIEFKKNASLKRNDKIDVIEKYKDRILIDKLIVIPAGIRDIKEDAGRQEKDSINSLYASVLNNARAMPDGADMDPIFNQVHYAIQRKVMEVYEYLLEMTTGKTGYFEGKYGARDVALGTRNVITATSLEATDPTSPQYHKVDETKVPLYQAAKGVQPLIVHYIRTVFYSPIITDSADNVPLIDPETLQLTYVTVDDKDKDAMITSEGILKTIDKFRDPEFRFRSVSARAGGKPYYLYLVYDDKDKIYVFRNIFEFKQIFEELKKPFDPHKVRPLSYAEMLYVATYVSTKDKFGTITRYPVTDNNSIYPTRTHLISTSPARVVKWITHADTETGLQLPEYPVLSAKFVDALLLHPSKLKGLAADFDGDTVSWIPLLSNEVTKECEKYVHDKSNFIEPSGLPVTVCDDLCAITMYALTSNPKK